MLVAWVAAVSWVAQRGLRSFGILVSLGFGILVSVGGGRSFGILVSESWGRAVSESWGQFPNTGVAWFPNPAFTFARPHKDRIIGACVAGRLR